MYKIIIYQRIFLKYERKLLLQVPFEWKFRPEASRLQWNCNLVPAGDMALKLSFYLLSFSEMQGKSQHVVPQWNLPWVFSAISLSLKCSFPCIFSCIPSALQVTNMIKPRTQVEEMLLLPLPVMPWTAALPTSAPVFFKLQVFEVLASLLWTQFHYPFHWNKLE